MTNAPEVGKVLKIVAVLHSGMRDSLENFIEGRTIWDDYVIVANGETQSGVCWEV